MESQILGPRVNHCNCGVRTSRLLQHHVGDRFTHDIRSAHHHHLCTARLHASANNHLLDPRGSTWWKLDLRASDHEPPHIDWMESVHILVRVDGIEDLFLINAFGQGQLHQDAMYGVIPIVLVNQA